MTHGHGTTSASAPTLANPANSCGETARSRVFESSERDCTLLDDSDDDDWPDGGYTCFSVRQTRELAAEMHGPSGAS